MAPDTPTDPAGLRPDAARALFREGLTVATSGWSAGWTQANLIAVPRDLAEDVRLFAERNPRSCPVLGSTGPGEVACAIFDGDLRTDLPGYRVYEDGELVAEVSDVRDVWRDDLVAFLIGCSFTFEAALLAAGVPVRHLEVGSNVPDVSHHGGLRAGRVGQRAARRLHAAGPGRPGGHGRAGHRALPRRPRCPRPRR